MEQGIAEQIGNSLIYLLTLGKVMKKNALVAVLLKNKLPICVGLGFLLLSNGVMAQDMGDGLCGFYNKFMGKTLFGVTLFSIVGGGLAIMFGGEMSDYLKTLAKIVMVVGIMLAGAQVLAAAFKAFGGMTC